MSKQRPRSPRFAREVTVPAGVAPKVDLIRKLSRQMKRMADHFRSNVKRWRSYGAKEALRIKHQQRAEALEALKAQAPRVYEALTTELNLVQQRKIT